MRILQIAPPWFCVPPSGYGGIEQVVSLLADGLTSLGHDVTLLAAGGSQTSASLQVTFPEPPSERLGDTAVELTHVLQGYRSKDGFDVIHDHTLTGAALGAVATGPPVVHTLHGPWTSASIAFYRQVCDQIHLVAISYDQASRAPSDMTIADTVYNGIEVDRFPFVARKTSTLAFVGRANSEKGPELAIEAARRVGMPLKMAIKVNEPSERDYFASVVAPHLDNADVEVLINADIAVRNRIVSGASALLFPIRWPEPFGLVPLEANACGTPVVAFGEGAVPEVVINGVSGFVVPPGDLDAFCDAIRNVDTLDPQMCRSVARSRLDASHMVAGYANLYERVTSSRRSTSAERAAGHGGHSSLASTLRGASTLEPGARRA